MNPIPSPSCHVPVLSQEVLHWLDPHSGQVFADGTLGGGGHTRLLAEYVGPQGSVISVDADPEAIRRAEQNLCGAASLDCPGQLCRTSRDSKIRGL